MTVPEGRINFGFCEEKERGECRLYSNSTPANTRAIKQYPASLHSPKWTVARDGFSLDIFIARGIVVVVVST